MRMATFNYESIHLPLLTPSKLVDPRRLVREENVPIEGELANFLVQLSLRSSDHTRKSNWQKSESVSDELMAFAPRRTLWG